jgi:hypothetical protein
MDYICLDICACIMQVMIACACVVDHSCAALPDAGSYRDVCVALRQEHDREVLISQQLQVSWSR